MTTPMPSWGDILPLTTEDWKELPDTPTPYYVYADEGMFLHRRIALGRGLVRWNKKPSKLQKVGHWKGYFKFDAEPIPASIYAQAVHFFRRVWYAHKTEAEVIITQHRDTKEYRLFVPTQRVSAGGVHSIYNPQHIDRKYLVVGTFHSHCDFSPYHSSTDEGDASDMDGIHGTIGYLTKDVPEMALMIALNGQLFHFGLDTLEDGTKTYLNVVDMTDLTADTAPEWWDRYLIFGTVTDAMRQEIAPYADDAAWDRFMGRHVKKVEPKPAAAPAQLKTYRTPMPSEDMGWSKWFDGREDTLTYYAIMQENGYDWDPHLKTFRWMGYPISRESAEFNARRNNLRALPAPKSTPSPSWGKDGELLAKDKLDGDYWEDALGKDFVDSLFNTGLFTEDDLDAAIDRWPDSGNPQFWESRMRNKLFQAVGWLRSHGYEVKVTLKSPAKPVPGQTTIEEHMTGGY